MNPFLKDVLTISFSTSALIVSLISLVFGILNYRRQGGLVKFHLDYDRKASGGIFLLTIENKGFHSIKINQIRMVVRNKPYPVTQEGFNLDYGTSEVVKISLAGYKEFHPSEVNRIEVVDIADKVYKISTEPLRQKFRL